METNLALSQDDKYANVSMQLCELMYSAQTLSSDDNVKAQADVLLDEIKNTIIDVQEIVERSVEKVKALSTAVSTNKVILQDLKTILTQSIVLLASLKPDALFNKNISYASETILKMSAKYMQQQFPKCACDNLSDHTVKCNFEDVRCN